MRRTQIKLVGLVYYGYHGVLEEESRLGQRFTVDLIATLSQDCKYETDSTEDTVNYVALEEIIRHQMTEKRYQLIEAAANAIAQSVLQRHNRIDNVTVMVKKPSVPVDCVCDYFAAEVHLERDG